MPIPTTMGDGSSAALTAQVGLGQHPGQLPPADQEVIGPLEVHRYRAECDASVGCGQGDHDAGQMASARGSCGRRRTDTKQV